MECFNLFLR